MCIRDRGNADVVADQGIDSQGIVTKGEATEGEWKFATVDYDFGDRLARYAPSKFYTYDKSKMKYLLIGVKVSSGDLLLDDFSLTVKMCIRDRQKNRMAMSDGISADLIRKTPDNNVAQVLGRVSGVTIDKGKYVVVRGMSERYNNVQLNRCV